jgi:hypothetical protein
MKLERWNCGVILETASQSFIDFHNSVTTRGRLVVGRKVLQYDRMYCHRNFGLLNSSFKSHNVCVLTPSGAHATAPRRLELVNLKMKICIIYLPKCHYNSVVSLNNMCMFFVVVVPCISINIKVFCDQQMHTLLT